MIRFLTCWDVSEVTYFSPDYNPVNWCYHASTYAPIGSTYYGKVSEAVAGDIKSMIKPSTTDTKISSYLKEQVGVSIMSASQNVTHKIFYIGADKFDLRVMMNKILSIISKKKQNKIIFFGIGINYHRKVSYSVLCFCWDYAFICMVVWNIFAINEKTKQPKPFHWSMSS